MILLKKQTRILNHPMLEFSNLALLIKKINQTLMYIEHYKYMHKYLCVSELVFFNFIILLIDVDHSKHVSN